MKKILIIFILPLILLVGAGAGAVFMRLIPGVGPELILGEVDSPPKEPEKPKKITAPDPSMEAGEESIFFALEEIVVNLKSERKRPVFLLLSLILELPNAASKGPVEPLEPRIRDALNIYLSGLRPEDLTGFDAIQEVRNQVWRRLMAIVPDESLIANIQIPKMTVK
ncbi:MAG: hypothetical protein CMM47_06330 [Rhodospirillaceae bacterium]|nr:hypothetical protein [Rhodospirillaceae bacterium]|tara:strand:- start:71 stop:571 length:501 start_codon:yes stop_codon:yes gene_type:complete